MKLDFYEFNEGNAKGIKIYTTAEYFKVYENGNTDAILDALKKHNA